jgi:tRNA G10  N-methylase Trm11
MRKKSSTITFDSLADQPTMVEDIESKLPSRELLIHWRGEKDVGYSKPFRHLEFTSALEAELQVSSENKVVLKFKNALKYTGEAVMADVSIEHFNEAMQYVSLSDDSSNDVTVTREGLVSAVSRSSLVHAMYEVIACAEDIGDLAKIAIEDGGFADMYKGGINSNSTWCFRARNYGDFASSEDASVGKEKRYSSRARSMKMEREGLKALTDLLLKFGGKVDLVNPNCKLYVFDGLEGSMKVLARRIAVGPRTSSIAPATRICITNTPLEPIAAFSLCNVARIRNGMSILDPYAGSCATLLAASMICPESQTVGIEIAHNGMVNREDVRKDFSSRELTQPKALLHGDSTDIDTRRSAKEAVDHKAFDAIVADPPYGIRESLGYNDKSPLEELFSSIAKDRKSGDRLLRIGGRLVAFVAVTDEETLSEMLPDEELTYKGGLEFEVSREQPLNDKLSRWLVSYICKR